MKYTGKSLLAAALAVLLVGCGQNSHMSNQPEQNKTGEVPLHTVWWSDEKGRYDVSKDGTLMAYIDFENAVEVPLCAQPNCEHNSDSCPAFIPEDCYVGMIWPVDKDHIVYKKSRQVSEEQRTDSWYLANRDGSEPKLLSEEPYQSSGYLELVDGSNLYFWKQVWNEELGKNEFEFSRLSREGGEREKLFSVPQADLHMLGASGREMIYITWEEDYSNLPDPDYPENATLEERERIDAEYMKQQEAVFRGKSTVWVQNVDTGERREFVSREYSFGGEDAISKCFWEEDTLYWTEKGKDEFVFWKKLTGEEGQIQMQLPTEILQAQERIIKMQTKLKDQLLLYVEGPWGEKVSKCFLADMNSGEVREHPLRYVYVEQEVPIAIIDKANDELLVLFDNQMKNKNIVHENGEVSQDLVREERMGMITVDDYLAGIPSYREINTDAMGTHNVGW